MKLLVVIVNYRTAELTIDCLRSLESEVKALRSIQVHVMDGDSGDGSAEQIAGAIEDQGWEWWARCTPLDANRGFASANNVAIRTAFAGDSSPAYVLLLNPDTVARRGAIRALLDFMDAHQEVGIAGSRLEHPDGTPQASAFRFITPLSELLSTLRLGVLDKLLSPWVVAPAARDEIHEADWVSGASFIVRREVFEEIGLLDEGYFLYFEELDFCLRARRKGWRCWYVPDSRVVHLVSASTGMSDLRNKAARCPAYWFEARRRYFLKNFGPVRALLADSAWIVGYGAWRFRRFVQRKEDRDPPFFLGDFVRQSVFCRGFAL